MRLRVTNDPDELLDIYEPKELVVQQKYDGHKVMATSTKRGIRLYSRRGVDITKRVPTIVARLDQLLAPGDTVLGEMVYIERGHQSLEKAQSILHSSKPGLAAAKLKRMPGRLVFFVYDLLEHQGKSIAKRPLEVRKAKLDTLIPRTGEVRVVKDYTWRQSKRAIEESMRTGGEGIVIKVKNSPYVYRKKGSSEPWGSWWKYKVLRQETADVIITKEYRRGKEKLIFVAYQIGPKGRRIEVGRLSGLDKKTEREVKKMVDAGKEVVAEVSHQGRRPSGKLRDMGWIRLRPDKPVRSATMEPNSSAKNDTMGRTMANPRKKKAAKKKAKKATPRRRAVKPVNLYVIYEDPEHLYIHSFSSNDMLMPGAAAFERALLLRAKEGGQYEIDHQSVKIYTEAQLKRMLRKDPRRLMPGRHQRLPNPRRSLVKEALEAEATKHRKFESFSDAYWNECARGIYWIATNERDFVIGTPERRMMEAGRFFVSCNPELALSGRNEDKRYVAELNVNTLPSSSFRSKRGAASTQIKIIDNIGKVRVMRTMPAAKAKRAFKYQQGILPSSKEQLRKFWQMAWKKKEEREEKEREKARRLKDREQRRVARMVEEERKAAKRRAKARAKAKKKAAKEREAKGRKAAAERERRERERKRRTKKRSSKKKRKKNPGSRSHTVPVRMISKTVNNPGR